jgi:NitT/TauT family transport system substrate-binding protein
MHPGEFSANLLRDQRQVAGKLRANFGPMGADVMRKFFFGLVAGVAAAGLTAVAASAEPVNISIPQLSMTFSPDYIADAKGYWKDQGLEVTFEPILGIGGINALIAGSVDVARVTADGFLLANARGQKLLAIGNTLNRIQLEIVVSKAFAQRAGIGAASPLSTRLRALKGARIGVGGANAIIENYVKYAAIKGGLDGAHDITFSPMQPLEMLAALHSGQIDGLAMSRPWPSMARLDEGAVTIVSSPTGDFPELTPFAYNLIVTRDGYCAAHAATCRKIVRGYRLALEFMHDHPDEAIAVLMKRFDRTKPELVADAFKGVIAGTPRVPAIEDAGLLHVEDYMVFAGMFRADERYKTFTGLYTNDYVK